MSPISARRLERERHEGLTQAIRQMGENLGNLLVQMGRDMRALTTSVNNVEVRVVDMVREHRGVLNSIMNRNERCLSQLRRVQGISEGIRDQLDFVYWGMHNYVFIRQFEGTPERAMPPDAPAPRIEMDFNRLRDGEEERPRRCEHQRSPSSSPDYGPPSPEPELIVVDDEDDEENAEEAAN